MKRVSTMSFIVIAALAGSVASAASPARKTAPKPAVSKPVAPPPPPINTIEDLNASLLPVGFSWKSGSSGYYPSFYTGFAPRVEEPGRIHLRLARGNQARLTVVLDEYAVLTYPYNLKARAEVMQSMMDKRVIAPYGKSGFEAFRTLVNSPLYGVAASASAYDAGRLSREGLYEASLKAMKALNPGRVFPIRFDFTKAALAWRDTSLKGLAEKTGAADINSVAAALGKNLNAAIVVSNDLLFGRVNTSWLTPAQRTKLAELIVISRATPASDAAFVEQAVGFFHDVTAGRYQFRVVENGRFRSALDCSTGRCSLVYPEFTAIYPVGSVLATVADRHGNRINMIREPGVLRFVERSYADVDNIRSEPYYGYLPKMDYTPSGNGFHNPAVRTWLPRSSYRGLYGTLGIPKSDDTLWIVSRGGVSHGCTRVAAGQLNEMRNILPSSSRAMTRVLYTGNNSADYDVFDVNGDGSPEVMGVQYWVAYKLVSSSGDGYREANGLISESFDRDRFYPQLYGRNGQFTVENGVYVFTNPAVSYFNGVPTAARAKPFSVVLQGRFPLYEQAYEKDKMQLFTLPQYGIGAISSGGSNRVNRAAQVVRLTGRVTSCGPFAAEMKSCTEKTFENELANLTGIQR